MEINAFTRAILAQLTPEEITAIVGDITRGGLKWDKFEIINTGDKTGENYIYEARAVVYYRADNIRIDKLYFAITKPHNSEYFGPSSRLAFFGSSSGPLWFGGEKIDPAALIA